MDMKNILLFGALIAGVGLTANSQIMSDGNTVNELIRNGSLSVVGLLGLLWNNFSFLKSKLLFKFGTQPEEQVFKPKDFETEDFRCLIHLRNRVEQANDEEGLKVCAQLNTILFNIRQRVKVKEQINEEPADASKAAKVH